MQDRQISIVEALNQTQSWLNAGEYEKTIQACQEILSIEPGNQRALALMKQAQERRHQNTTPLTPPMSPVDPLAKLAVEEPKQTEASREIHRVKSPTPSEKRGLLMAMLIPAVLVVLIGGLVIWFLAQKQKEEPTDPPNSSATEQDYIAENEQRVEEILEMEKILEAYSAKHGVYPAPDQINSILTFTDPRNGEEDKAGRLFGYIYAVYNKNSEYVLSGLFEDSRGFGSPWARGGSIKTHPDFRDTRLSNVVVIQSEVKTAPKPKPTP